MERNMFQNMSIIQSYKNGKLVKTKQMNVKYDGKKLNVEKIDNGKKECYSIKKDSIEKILSQPQSRESLEKRLKKLKTKCKTHKRKPKKSAKNKTKKSAKNKTKKSAKSKSRK